MFTTKTPTISQMFPLRLRTEFFRRVYFHRPKPKVPAGYVYDTPEAARNSRIIDCTVGI